METRKGFTLIELMIVVVIIGILAAIAIPKFTMITRGAKEAEAGPILKQLYTLQERHRHQHGAYAVKLADLEGGTVPYSSARHYEFALSPDAQGAAYVACATPKDANLRYFTITSGGTLQARETGCS